MPGLDPQATSNFDPRFLAEFLNRWAPRVQNTRYVSPVNSPAGSDIGFPGAPQSQSNPNAPSFNLAQQTTGPMDAAIQGAKAGSTNSAIMSATGIPNNGYTNTAATVGLKAAGPFGMPLAMADFGGRVGGALTGLMQYAGVNANPNANVGIMGNSFGPNDLNGDITSGINTPGTAANAANAYSGMSLNAQIAAIAAALGLGPNNAGPLSNLTPALENEFEMDDGAPGPASSDSGGNTGSSTGTGGASDAASDTGGLIGANPSRIRRIPGDPGHVQVKRAMPSEFIMNPHATGKFLPILQAMNALARPQMRRPQMPMGAPQSPMPVPPMQMPQMRMG